MPEYRPSTATAEPICDWRWQNGEGTEARKCIRPHGHPGNHVGFWSMPQSAEPPATVPASQLERGGDAPTPQPSERQED